MSKRFINNATIHRSQLGRYVMHLAQIRFGAPILAAHAIILRASAAGAQNIPAAQVYIHSGTVQTNIPGVTTFADPPAGFNPGDRNR